MFNKNRTYEQHDNEKISFYKSSVEDLNSQDQLTSDIDADICIIGGGLTGISSAINLSKKGYSVILCEARKIGITEIAGRLVNINEEPQIVVKATPIVLRPSEVIRVKRLYPGSVYKSELGELQIVFNHSKTPIEDLVSYLRQLTPLEDKPAEITN